MARVIGRAGSGPRGLIVSWRLRQLAAFLGSFAMALLVMGVGTNMTAVPRLGALIVAGLVTGLVWTIGEKRIRRARSGIVGEREVAWFLRRFGTILYGWSPMSARYDVDVVVLEPCVAAIEVKRASGWVRVRRDGSVTVGGVALPGEAVRQAVRGAASLRRELGTSEFVEAVLCITEMRQRPTVVEWSGVPVVVCSARHLRGVLRRLEPRSSPAQAQRYLETLGSWGE